MNLKPKRKHYLLIGADSKKVSYALYLTEKFTPIAKEAGESVKEDPVEENIQEEAFEEVDKKPRTAMIIGRVRRLDAKPVAEFGVSLLNEDLAQQSTTKTDEFGIFKI